MSQNGPIVLHVDDDEDIREIVRIALELVGGLTVIQCASGQEALDVIQDAKPDLFLLDVMMPDMCGVQTLAALRQIEGYEQTPAFFVTAKVETKDVAKLMESGAAGIIRKPFDPMTLSGKVMELWAEVNTPQELVAV